MEPPWGRGAAEQEGGEVSCFRCLRASARGDWPRAIDLGPRSSLVVGGDQAGGEEGLGAGLNGEGGRGRKHFKEENTITCVTCC